MAKKRSFRKLNGSRIYRAWKGWNNGEALTGKYVGQSEDSYHRPNWHLEIEEADFEYQEDIDKYEVGKVIGLNSCGTLDKVMETLEIGETVHILYTGMFRMEKGPYAGKDCHTMEVSVLEEDGTYTESKQEESGEDYGL